MIVKLIIEIIVAIMNLLESIWMDPIKEEQKEYEKPIILTPNDGSDWKREKW